MNASDPIRAALERLVELDDGCTADHWHAAITAARAALDAATEGEPSDEELRDLWSWSSGQDQGPWPTQYHCFARAVLSRWGRPSALDAATEGQPSDQEIADVFSQGCRDLSRSYEPPFLGGARAIFARWGRPALAAAPEGEGPSKSDVANLFYRHMGEGSEVGFENAIAEALARWGRPAAPPAPLEGEVEG